MTDEDAFHLPVRLRRELLGEGFSDKGLTRAVRDGSFARPRRGAYVDGDRWQRLDPAGRYLVRCRAAARQANVEVFLSHTSALPMFGAPMWGLDLSECHLTRIDGRIGRSEAGLRQHSGRVQPGDVLDAEDIRYSSGTRAALEITTTASTEAAVSVVCHLLARRQCTPESLRSRYEASMTQWPHTLRTDLVLRLADPRITSVGEARTWFLFWREGLPKPIPQYEIYDDGGLFAQLDFALPEHGIWIEFDGRVKYQKHLRPGESVTDAVIREKLREEKVAELTGWRCLRITWADLDDPIRLVSRIRALIASVARARARAGSHHQPHE